MTDNKVNTNIIIVGMVLLVGALLVYYFVKNNPLSQLAGLFNKGIGDIGAGINNAISGATDMFNTVPNALKESQDAQNKAWQQQTSDFNNGFNKTKDQIEDEINKALKWRPI